MILGQASKFRPDEGDRVVILLLDQVDVGRSRG